MRKGKTTQTLNNVAHEISKRLLLLPIAILSLLLVDQTHAADSVELNLSATIEKSCAITRTDGETSTSFDSEEGKMEIGFTVDCNTPFKYSLASGNGELVNTSGSDVSTSSDTIHTALTYSTTFEVTGLQDGDTGTIKQSCESTPLAIKNGDGTDNPSCTGSVSDFATSGTSIAVNTLNNATLSLAIDNYIDGFVAGAPLLAGDFEDALTLTVTVQP